MSECGSSRRFQRVASMTYLGHQGTDAIDPKGRVLQVAAHDIARWINLGNPSAH
jgi:hypothetical protein